MKIPAAKPDMNLPIANVGVVGMQVKPLENIISRSEYIIDFRRPTLANIGPATEAPNKAPIVTRKLKTGLGSLYTHSLTISLDMYTVNFVKNNNRN